MRSMTILGALVMTTLGCSRTAPESQWPPPGPTEGLPVIPFPDEGFGEESDNGEVAETPATPTAKPGALQAVDGALPPSPPTVLSRTHTCSQKECRLTAYLPDPAFVPTGSPAAMWAEVVGENSTVVIPRHHKLELLVMTLSGTAHVVYDEGGGAKPLGTWDALRVPGAGVMIKSDKGGAKLVMALVATTGTLSEALTLAKDKPFAVRWLKRARAPVASSLGSAKDLAWGGGAFHARIAFGGADPAIPGSFEVLETSANAAIAEHDHTNWEHIAILEGAGTMRVDGKNVPVKAGSVFDIAPGVKHSYSPSGAVGLLAVQTYTPSGPEQRFLKLSTDATSAAKKRK